MKRILLISALLSFTFTSTNAQSFEIRPDAGYITGDNPDLDITGSDEPQIRGRRYRGLVNSPSPLTTNTGLLELTAAGHNGLSFTGDRVSIRFTASENWTTTANGTDIRFVTTTNGSTSQQERMRLTHRGYLGLNNFNPTMPLHVNHASFTTNSETGIVGIGLFNNEHLTLDQNEINAWFGGIAATLYLNYHSQGKVQIGNGAAGADLDVNGYTNLGDGAPKVKMKELSGTTSVNIGGVTNITHGISNADKILSVDVTVNADAISIYNSYVPPNYTYHAGHEFNYYYGDNVITVRNMPGNSANILSKTIKILVTYKE